MPRNKLPVRVYPPGYIPICEIEDGRFAATYGTNAERASRDFPLVRAKEHGAFEKIIARHSVQYAELIKAVLNIRQRNGVSFASMEIPEKTKIEMAEGVLWVFLETFATNPDSVMEKADSNGQRFRAAYAIAPDFLLEALSKIRSVLAAGITDRDRVYVKLNTETEIQIGKRRIPLREATDGEVAMAFKTTVETAKKARQYKAKFDDWHFSDERLKGNRAKGISRK